MSYGVDGVKAVAKCGNLAPVVGDCIIGDAVNVSSGHGCPLCHACSLKLDMRFWGRGDVGAVVGCVLTTPLVLYFDDYLSRRPGSRLSRRTVCGGTSGVCGGTMTSLCGCVKDGRRSRKLRKAYQNVCSCGALAASRTVGPVHNKS